MEDFDRFSGSDNDEEEMMSDFDPFSEFDDAVITLKIPFKYKNTEQAKSVGQEKQASKKTLLDFDLGGKAPSFEPTVSSDAPVFTARIINWRPPSFNSLLESYGMQKARRAEQEGDLNRAVELWTAEQEQLKKYYGNDQAVYETQKELARLYEMMPAKSAEARIQYEAMLETCKKSPDWKERYDSKVDPAVSAILLKIAKTYEAEGEIDKALESLSLALAVAEKGESDYIRPQRKDSSKVECRKAMAAMHIKSGKIDEAIKDYQEIVELLKRQSGYSVYGCPQDKDIVATQGKMADSFVKAGKWEDAAKVHEANLAIIKRQWGYSDYSESAFDNDVLQTQRAIARIRIAQGRYDEAFKTLDENCRLLDRKYRSYGGDNKAGGAYAQYYGDIADAYAKRASSRTDDMKARNSDYDEAFKAREKELEIYNRARGYDYGTTLDANIFAVQREMANYLKEQGKDHDALRLQEKQIYLLERAETNPEDIAICMEKIAGEYEKLGELDRAVLMRKSACYKLEGREGYAVARELLAETYRKDGKDIRVEEAREDKEEFDRCDAIEKFPYIFSKLPRRLAIETSDEGTKLSMDDLPRLLETVPGMMLDRVLRDALCVGKSPEEAEKIAEAIMLALRETTDIFITGNKIEFIRKSAAEIPYGVDLGVLGKVSSIKLGEKISFELAVDSADSGKVSFKNIQGISAQGQRPRLSLSLLGQSGPSSMQPFSVSFSTLEISERSKKDATRDRMLSIDGMPPITLQANVSDADSASYRQRLNTMTETLGKLGKGDLNGLLRMLGGDKIPHALKELFADVTAIKKDGGRMHMDLKKAHVMAISDFAGGGALDGNPTVMISSAVDFYMSPSTTHSFDLSNIRGITLSSDGWLGRLLGERGHLTANLSMVFIGGQIDGNRGLNIGFERGLHSLWVKLNGEGQPKPNSTIHATLDNPVGGKRETIDIKVDENGNLSKSDILGEVLYLLLEGIRR